MWREFTEFFSIFSNIVVPLMAGSIYFIMAKYVRHIGPMRTLISGELTYRGAYWGFIFLGIYLITRPLQLLAPHPWPMIVNNVREIFLIGLFGPSVFLAMMSFVFGADNIPGRIIRWTYAVAGFLATLFIIVNIYAIGGSEPIFRIGDFTFHDGLWFKNPRGDILRLMTVLFIIRLVDPVLIVLTAGTVVLWHARNYPPEKKVLYDNMPRKLYLLGLACYVFSLSMLAIGLIYVFAGIPNQWWIFYLGALAAGFLETLSLSMPMKRHVQVSEHQ